MIENMYNSGDAEMKRSIMQAFEKTAKADRGFNKN
jgi:hypothetical protein